MELFVTNIFGLIIIAVIVLFMKVFKAA